MPVKKIILQLSSNFSFKKHLLFIYQSQKLHNPSNISRLLKITCLILTRRKIVESKNATSLFLPLTQPQNRANLSSLTLNIVFSSNIFFKNFYVLTPKMVSHCSHILIQLFCIFFLNFLLIECVAEDASQTVATNPKRTILAFNDKRLLETSTNYAVSRLVFGLEGLNEAGNDGNREGVEGKKKKVGSFEEENF